MKVRCERGWKGTMFDCITCKHYGAHDPLPARKSTPVINYCDELSFYCPADNMPAKCVEVKYE